jgi:Kdo2-lipid IVA lauroyltransferase/acyltransferase
MGKPQDSLFMRAGKALGLAGLDVIIWFVSRLGYDRIMALGAVAGDFLSVMLRRPRMRIHHNLLLALGRDLTEAARNEIAGRVLQYFAKNWLELFFYAGEKKQDVRGRITLEGLEHLDRALAKGKGVIAVSGHIGNYGLLGTQLTERGYDFTVVIRDPKNPVIASIYEKGRGMMGLQTFSTTPERQFFKNTMKALSRNGILCLIADENKRTGGIFVDFFGRPASTPPGPAALARRTGAAIVPIFITRNPDNSQHITILQEIVRQKTDDAAADVQTITQLFTAVIEQRIRRDLAQWMWTNFRWRTQPGGPSDAAKLKKFQPVKRLKKKLRRMLNS